MNYAASPWGLYGDTLGVPEDTFDKRTHYVWTIGTVDMQIR